MAWILYHKDGTAIKDANGKSIEIHSLEYSGEWMGECSVAISIENEAPIEFAIGDYIEYRGERFELNYEPGKLKQARKNSTGDAFKYDSMKWNSMSDELARAEFLDVVLNDNEIHYTALPKFVFYIETLDDLLDRLQANMNEQIGEGKWCFYSRNWARSEQRGGITARWEEIYGGKASVVEETGVEDNVIDSTSISIDNQSVWDGLALVNSQFDINFVIRNREVFVGTAGLPTRNVFQYGKGKGLYEIDQNTESDQKIVTRLRAYGSDKNLPTRYYATLNLEVWGEIEYCGLVDGDNFEFGIDLNKSQISAFFHTIIDGKPGHYAVRVKCGETSFDAEAVEGDVWLKMIVYQTASQTLDFLKKIREAIVVERRVYFTSGVNKENFPLDHKNYATQNLPDNMSCDRLMLPGFPNESLDEWWNKQTAETKQRLNPTGAELRFSTRKDRPWIESSNADEIGVRSGSVYFDTDDVKNKIEEIFPTLKEMTINGKRVDVVYKGSEIEDNGVFKEGQDIPSFKIILDEAIDFDINDLKNSDFSVVMTDGMCAGRTFKVGGSVRENGHWVLTMQRTEDNGIYYPYKDFQISAGDHYVLTGIDMPDEYIEAASEKLLQYAIMWLLANDHTRRSYVPKIDEIFMARQHDIAIADKTGTLKSLHDTLKEGDIMQFEDEDLGIKGQVVINNLSIKEEDGKIPTYEVTLRDDKEVGTLQKMQSQIDSFVSGNGKGGGTTGAQVKDLIQSEGSRLFLSKLKPDVAQEIIRFFKGLAFGAASDGNTLGISSDGIATLKEVVSSVFNSGALGTGFKLGTYGDTEDSYLEVDRMLVRKAAEFVELVIRELRHVGGEVILTPAAMKCINVAAYDKKGFLVVRPDQVQYYRCYFQQEVDGEEVTNDFVAGDLVRCQTFNIKEGTTSGAKNRYYWRRCINVGKNYIDLSALDRDVDSDIPQAGDELVQLGNDIDETRQSAIILSAYGDDAPSIKLYRGIDSYSLTGKEVVVLSRKEVSVYADKLRYRTSAGYYAGVDEKMTAVEKTAKDANNKADELEGTIDDINDEVTSVSDRITTLTADVNGIQTSVTALQTTQSSQGKTISNLSSRMTQTEKAITQEVSDRKEYVDGQVETLNSTITQTAENISLKVAQSQNALSNVFVGSAFREWDTLNDLKAKYPTKCYTGGVGGSRYARISVADATDSEWAGIRFGNYNISFQKGVKYTCSVWVRVQTVVASECYIRVNCKTSALPSATTTVLGTMQFDGTKTSGWSLYKAEITIPTNLYIIWADICVVGNGVIDVCRPMLNEGDYIGWSLSPKDVTESGNLEQKVKATGLDIENEKITATADKFEVRNNNGDTTASVNAKGVLEVNSGLFTGFVKKKPMTITPDNFDFYKSDRVLQNGYVEMDFEKTGSFLVFSGDLSTKLGSNNIALTLPCTGSSWTTSDYTNTEHPLAYIGQQFVVVNNSTVDITIAGGGAIKKNGSSTTSNILSNGQVAVVECAMESSYSTLGNTYKVAWNGTIYKQ